MENKPIITIDDFKKLEIKIGHILSAEKVPGSDKLLKLSVDFGLKPTGEERDVRQIVSGISKYFQNTDDLVGKKCAFVTNLEPRTILGLESQGMILAVSGIKSPEESLTDNSALQDDSEKNFFSLLETSEDVVPGSEVK